MANALEALARQVHLKTFYSDDTVSGRMTSGINGRYTLREALDRLLPGSGLTPTFLAEDAVALKRSDNLTKTEAEQTKQATTDQTTPLPAMTVTAKAWKASSYNVPNATTATKTDTP